MSDTDKEAVPVVQAGHPDIEGHLADAIRDCFRQWNGTIISFDKSTTMACAALSALRTAHTDAADALAEALEAAPLRGKLESGVDFDKRQTAWLVKHHRPATAAYRSQRGEG